MPLAEQSLLTRGAREVATIPRTEQLVLKQDLQRFLQQCQALVAFNFSFLSAVLLPSSIFSFSFCSRKT